MINPQSLDLSTLPWLPLNERLAFPSNPAIYFAIDGANQIQYIGRSINPKQRWQQHHRFSELKEIGSIRIAYLFVDDPALLPGIEEALIQYFNPLLNCIKRLPMAKITSSEKVDLKELREQAQVTTAPTEALRKTIFEFKLTGAQLARDAGLTKAQVSNFKNGAKDLTTESWLSLIRAMPREAQTYYLDLVFASVQNEQDKKPLPACRIATDELIADSRHPRTRAN